MAIFMLSQVLFDANVTFRHTSGSGLRPICVFRVNKAQHPMLTRLLLATALLLVGTAQAQLSPGSKAPLAAHLLEVNAQWDTQDPHPADGTTAVSFSNEAERIATHLRMVRELLRQRQPEGLSANQSAKRSLLLDRLSHYANERRFPQNHVLPYRNPVFIDPLGTACAVGWLMIESGHRDLAEEISTAMNLAYVLEMPGTQQWPAIAAWANEHGFEAAELAWIQPGYPPNIPWAAFGGGTDGPVKVVLTLQNGNVLVGGSFAEAGGNAANQVALWNGNALVPLGDGLEGEVNCAVEFNGDIYVGGSMLSGIADLAKWNGSVWEFSVVTDGKLPWINALHVHDGTLHAAGELMGFAGVDHRVLRYNGTAWEPVGQVLNGKIRTLESFNGELIAGGEFTTNQWGTEPTIRRVARLDGNEWTQLGIGLDATVRDLLVVNDALHACGDLYANVLPTFGLARWQAGNNTWEHLLPNHTQYLGGGFGPAYFNAMAEHDGLIHLVGSFDLLSILDLGNNVASFNGQPDGLQVLAYLDRPVNAVSVSADRLIIGGDFDNTFPHLAAVDLATTLADNEGQLRFSLAPVPADIEVFITWTGPLSATTVVEVADAQGRTVALRLENFGEGLRMDVSALAPGVYVARMLVDGRTITGRFIKS